MTSLRDGAPLLLPPPLLDRVVTRVHVAGAPFSLLNKMGRRLRRDASASESHFEYNFQPGVPRRQKSVSKLNKQKVAYLI